MNIKRFKLSKVNVDLILFLLIFCIVFSVYLFTLAPTVFIEDSGELITATTQLGIAHPPGYPLYTILGKFFSLIPVGSLAWRVNMMSAFFGSLAVSILFLIVKKITNSRAISFSAALLLAFNPIYWSQSIFAEVYTLNVFFVSLCIYLLLIWQEQKKEKYLFIFSFVFGLSITNHQMMLLLAPAFVLYIVLNKKDILKNFKLIKSMFWYFLIGLAVYLYLPLRSLQNPVLDWGNPETLRAFWGHIARKQYGDFSILSQPLSKFSLVAIFVYSLVQDFLWPMFVLSALGIFTMFKKNRNFAYLSLSIFLLNSVGLILLRNSGGSNETEYVFRVYYLPCFLILVIWFAYTIKFGLDKIKKLLSKQKSLLKIVNLVVLIVVVLLPLNYLVANYKLNDQSDFWLTYDYGKKLLASLEPNATLLYYGEGSIASDTQLFTLMYLQMVENFRPDVFIVDELNFFKSQVSIAFPTQHFNLVEIKRKDALLNLLWQATQEYDLPLYTSFIVNEKSARDLEIFSRSNGWVNKVYPNIESAKEGQQPTADFSLRNLENKSLELDYSMGGFLSIYYYGIATNYLENGHDDLAYQTFMKAIELDPQPFSQNYKDYITHREEWNK